MEDSMKQPTEQNKSSLTQVVVSSDKTAFLITKVLTGTNIVCPFIKSEGEYFTNFSTPTNRVYRIQALYQAIPKLSTYSITDNIITFDCVNKLPSAAFKDVDNGIIHFNAIDNEDSDDIEIDPKLVLKLVEPESVEIRFDQPIKFKTKFLKVFPIILTNGFILSIVDRDECTIFITLNNPEKNFIGNCLRQEIINIIQNLIPIWPIFNINISKSTRIYIREQYLPNEFRKETNPILINLTYRFEDPKMATIMKIATGT